MKTIEAVIRGTSPLLMNKFTVDADPTRKVLVTKDTPQEQAERAAYKKADGTFFLPLTAILRLLRDSGANHKLRGSRKSARFVVPAAVRIVGEELLLTNGDGTSLLKSFVVDSRSVVIPSTKGRILCHRPRFEKWSGRFQLRINTDLLPDDFVRQLLQEGGEQIGIGAFRPEKGGCFGLFAVVEWGEVIVKAP